MLQACLEGKPYTSMGQHTLSSSTLSNLEVHLRTAASPSSLTLSTIGATCSRTSSLAQYNELPCLPHAKLLCHRHDLWPCRELPDLTNLLAARSARKAVQLVGLMMRENHRLQYRLEVHSRPRNASFDVFLAHGAHSVDLQVLLCSCWGLWSGYSENSR